jgi:very-short-patch-repair endonuclease
MRADCAEFVTICARDSDPRASGRATAQSWRASMSSSNAQLPGGTVAESDPAIAHAYGAQASGESPSMRDPAVAHADLRIGRHAAGQHDVIATEQLVALGLGRGAIAHRVRRGLLHPMHRGVYLWGSSSTPSLISRAQAALLACGNDAVISHHTAAELQGIRVAPAGPLDVTISGRRVRVRGIRTHDALPLAVADLRCIDGVAVTAAPRALLEIAPALTPRELANAVEHAQVKQLVTKRQLEEAIERAPLRPGVAALRALVDEPAFTRSRAERIVVALMRAARLPEPVFNAVVEDGCEVDALWQRERVVLEFDSYRFHATRAAFERDRAKTARLQRTRYSVLRTTWTELTRDSHALVARIAEALARAG